jgi:DNA-directed RNA polymerase subunit N (RpoN/RPB10)
MIIQNKIKCNNCGDIIESKYRHDFVSCKCGRVSADGGKDYLKRCFQETDDYEELSIEENE